MHECVKNICDMYQYNWVVWVQRKDKGNLGAGVGVDVLWFSDGLFSQQCLKAFVKS